MEFDVVDISTILLLFLNSICAQTKHGIFSSPGLEQPKGFQVPTTEARTWKFLVSVRKKTLKEGD